MKHLLIGSDLFKPSIGGTETVTENMAINMVRSGWRVTVIAPAPKGMQTPKIQKDAMGYDILRVQSVSALFQKKLRVAWRAQSQINGYLEANKNQPDVIHANNLFPISKVLLRYAKSHHIPIVFGNHLMPESFTLSLRRFRRINKTIDGWGWHYIASVYNKGNMVISPTQTGINYLTRHGLKVPTTVISNGLDLKLNKPIELTPERTEELKKKLGITAQYVLLYAGRLGVEKRIDVIIRALSILEKQNDVQLVLIGDGNAERGLKRLVNKLNLANKVIFTGYVPRIFTKHEYMALCDAFVIASPVELQSIVTLEAMAAGLPIFAGNKGALKELAIKGINGGIFSDGNPVELARLVGGVLQDPVRLKEYSRGSLKLIKQHNIKDTWVKYNQMYREVIANYNNKETNS